MIIMRNNWTDKELETLKNNWTILSDEELHQLIPNHSISSISSKRKRLKLIRPHNKYTFDDVISLMNEKDYELLSTSEDYQNALSDIVYYCPRHKDKGILHTTLGHLLEGKGCIYCGHEKTAESERVTKEQAQSLCKEKGFKYVDNIMINHNTFIKFICPYHEDKGVQLMKYRNMAREQVHGCKYCIHSIRNRSCGEIKIAKYLDNHNILYDREHMFADCRNETALRFDFYLRDHNTVIEYDGQQHYEPVLFYTDDIEEAQKRLEKNQKRDKIKDDYCKNRNIKMIRIPYWEYTNIDNILKETITK